jgi:hypothetical protein
MAHLRRMKSLQKQQDLLKKSGNKLVREQKKVVEELVMMQDEFIKNKYMKFKKNETRQE